MWLSEFLSEAKEAGEIRDSVHAERTAKLFIALVESRNKCIYMIIKMMSKSSYKRQKY